MNRPFDGAHYEALLKGLEASAIPLSDLVCDNDSFRIDSEYHLKIYATVIDRIRKSGAVQFKTANPTIIHPTEIPRVYVEEGGTLFFRTQNLRPMTISHSNEVYISPYDASRLEKNRIEKGDVIITRTGANFGDCLYFDEENRPVASSHVLIVRNDHFNQAFLAVFLNLSLIHI